MLSQICIVLLCYVVGSGPYSEVVMPARNLCRGGSLVTALTVLMGIGVAVRGEGPERGVGYRQVDMQKSVHR